MQLRKCQWLYQILVGLLCAPALLLSGSLRGLQNQKSAKEKCDDMTLKQEQKSRT